jgi:hypothetical protein
VSKSNFGIDQVLSYRSGLGICFIFGQPLQDNFLEPLNSRYRLQRCGILYLACYPLLDTAGLDTAGRVGCHLIERAVEVFG